MSSIADCMDKNQNCTLHKIKHEVGSNHCNIHKEKLTCFHSSSINVMALCMCVCKHNATRTKILHTFWSGNVYQITEESVAE